ncbi:hypothetical protein [Methanohalophilus sp. DAL1]|uniref:hypothetical protein n=1 Tax=Methanohalophilus sp. DAL1 TaxID=1864608 RepID=UPI0025C5E02F|nr:hypothetical protein [Methanohalophilus sp. DAL1]
MKVFNGLAKINEPVKPDYESINGANNTSSFGSVRLIKDFVNVTMEIIYDSLNF